MKQKNVKNLIKMSMLLSLAVLATNCSATPNNIPVSTATPVVTESASSAPSDSGTNNPVASASPSSVLPSSSATPVPTSSQSSGVPINPVSSNSLNLQSDFLKISYVDYYSADLKWSSISGAKSYRIYQDGKLIADNVTASNYSVTKLTPNTDYNFEISALNDSGESNKVSLKVRTFIPGSSSSSSGNSGQSYVAPTNNSPVLTSITASDQTLSGLGYTTLLTAVASDDNNNIRYTWSVVSINGSPVGQNDSGTFTNTNGVAATNINPIRWTAPSTSNGGTGGFDTYKIQLSVTDGVNTAVVKTIDINVNNGTDDVNLSTGGDR